MADNFNENLAMFLTSCKELAIKELTENNADYKHLSSRATEISVRIKNEIPPQYETLIEELLDTYHALFGMEVHYLYLQGFRDCISLYKSLDGSFIESKDFEKIFL
jgi:hypothetical protein